jgi:hypothetical protein
MLVIRPVPRTWGGVVWLLSHLPTPVVRNSILTWSLYCLALTLRIFQLKKLQEVKTSNLWLDLRYASLTSREQLMWREGKEARLFRERVLRAIKTGLPGEIAYLSILLGSDGQALPQSLTLFKLPGKGNNLYQGCSCQNWMDLSIHPLYSLKHRDRVSIRSDSCPTFSIYWIVSVSLNCIS